MPLSWKLDTQRSRHTYTDAVRRLPVLLVVVPDLVEVVLVQLPDEACKVAVFEVFRKDMLRELLVLRAVSQSPPLSFDCRTQTSSTTKLSPSFPHLTTSVSVGFSNILRQGSVDVRGGAVAVHWRRRLTCRACEPSTIVSSLSEGDRGRCEGRTKSLELLDDPAPWPLSILHEQSPE